jgi:hypothetical protein
VAWQGRIVWNDIPAADELVLIHSEAEALERASEAARQGTYHDVHCWVFTPRSFGAVLDTLRRQGLLPFRVDHISPTAGNEFFATLVADEAPAPVGHSSIDQRVSETAALRAELADTERRLAAVTAERDAIINSRSWRAAGVLRAANRRLRRRGRGT